MRADVYTSESPLTIIYLVSLSIQVPQNRGNNALASSSLSTPNKNTTMVPTNPLPPASSSLTTFHNNSSSSNLALGFILTHRILISFFSCSIRIENGNGGSGGDNNHCIHLLLVVPTVDQRLQNGFLSPDSLRWSVSDAPRDHRQYHNEYNDSNLADETDESLEKKTSWTKFMSRYYPKLI